MTVRKTIASFALVGITAFAPVLVVACRERESIGPAEPKLAMRDAQVEPSDVATTEPSPTPPKGSAECRVKWSAMQSELAAVVASHTKCSTSADCTMVSREPCHGDHGCGGLWIATSGVASFKAVEKRQLDKECPWFDGGVCPPIATPTCTSPPFRAACASGTCTGGPL